MDKSYLNDPKFRRSFILYEFHTGNPIFNCFESLCDRMGRNFMSYEEFDFWFQRFASGNFDIDYDMSLEPKTRRLTDLPINIFKKITGNLEPFNRLVLRKVCKTFRTIVDSWDPKLEGIKVLTVDDVAFGNNLETEKENDDGLIQEISYGYYKLRSEFVKQISVRIHYDVIELKFNRSYWKYCRGTGNLCTVYTDYGKRFEQEGNNHNVAIDDLLSILCHPNLKLTSFVIDTPHMETFRRTNSNITEKFVEKLVERMENYSHRPQIHAEKVHLSCAGSIEELKLLNFFRAETVKTLKIGYSYTRKPENLTEQDINSVTKEIEGLELWETLEGVTFLPSILQADENFSILRVVRAPKMFMRFENLFVIRFKRISQVLLQNHRRLQFCKLRFRTKMAAATAKRHLESLGATPSSGSYKCRIPNSDNFFEIKIGEAPNGHLSSFLIERKRNISE